MDSNIRKLVHAATQDNDLSALSEAYNKLKKERQSSDDKIDAVSSDLFVLCAEAALKVCLVMLFIWNQWICAVFHWNSYDPCL